MRRALGGGMALLLAAALPAVAQERRGECASSSARPAVCQVAFYAGRTGERLREFDPRRGLSLGAGGEIELQIEALDQFGRRFPRDRTHFQLEAGRGCRDGVEIDERGDGRFLVRAGAQRGDCRLLLWGANDLNLEWEIPLSVASAAESGYSRAQAEFIVGKLYRALLGRDPDAGGFAGAVAEVQRGRLANQIDAMLRSAEFAEGRATLTPAQLLESYYRELLGRAPDSAGVRRYLDEVARGRSAGVLLDILRSQEFEQRLPRSSR